ncbi:PhzF family phenazine biosynthesis protein [Undibacterium sp. SXout11W]|uniref:PhzF family phenazine biosynthesis protein n=1 Tax=Undibacterium sp. SXout11W TaxID=3413050 RepID=UPI003BF231CC
MLIVTESNLSEATFFEKRDDDVYHMRRFSPIKEIPFCCHATLATAYVIFKTHHRFVAKSSRLIRNFIYIICTKKNLNLNRA